ncbi:hypothetical protein OT109_01895 [Phycisphaeraceae bacterium D3-23]
MPYFLSPIGRALTKLARSPLELARHRRAVRAGDLYMRYLDGHLSLRETDWLFAEIDQNPDAIHEMEKQFEVDCMLYSHFSKPKRASQSSHQESSTRPNGSTTHPRPGP